MTLKLAPLHQAPDTLKFHLIQFHHNVFLAEVILLIDTYLTHIPQFTSSLEPGGLYSEDSQNASSKSLFSTHFMAYFDLYVKFHVFQVELLSLFADCSAKSGVRSTTATELLPLKLPPLPLFLGAPLLSGVE